MDIYCSEIKLKNGDKAFVRPISNSDKALIVDLFSKMTPGSIYLRFLRNMDELPENIINKLINVDYNKSFALVVLTEGEAISVSRYGYDPDEKKHRPCCGCKR